MHSQEFSWSYSTKASYVKVRKLWVSFTFVLTSELFCLMFLSWRIWSFTSLINLSSSILSAATLLLENTSNLHLLHIYSMWITTPTPSLRNTHTSILYNFLHIFQYLRQIWNIDLWKKKPKHFDVFTSVITFLGKTYWKFFVFHYFVKKKLRSALL